MMVEVTHTTGDPGGHDTPGMMEIEIKVDGVVVASVKDGIALGSMETIKEATVALDSIEERPAWSAKIPPQEMAVVLCDDRTKKLRILGRVDPSSKKLIIQGLVGDSRELTFCSPKIIAAVRGYVKFSHWHYHHSARCGLSTEPKPIIPPCFMN